MPSPKVSGTIQEFAKRWPEIEQKLLSKYRLAHPNGYEDIFSDLVKLLGEDGATYDSPDPERVHVIDDGDYQGTLLFIVAARGYQPDRYWACVVGYGSCSGCDTFQAIQDYSTDSPSEQQAKDYTKLALHMLQELREIR